MHYSVRHTTRFRYSDSVRESVMEVRMQPRSEDVQRCLSFELRTNPRAQVSSYRDHLGNNVHHFDLPDRHTHLTIKAESLVELLPDRTIPDALDADAWKRLDVMTATGKYWDMLEPSDFARPSELLLDLARELHLERGEDPLSTVRKLATTIYGDFGYDTRTTRVDSPIDDALRSRQGVCQDFAHIMIALVRQLGIPCRYVSGYLFHGAGAHDRSARDASHAWVEALMPELGWVGFDPTNDLVVVDRHIRVAVGRDYADVPPTRGVFKGRAETELAVAVQVTPSRTAPPELPDMEEQAYHPTTELGGLPDEELHEQPQQ